MRALNEYLVVMATDAPGMYPVYSEDGEERTVDIRDGACTCPDAEYRDPAGGCKHQRVAAFLTGARDLPEWADADADAINAQLAGDAEEVLD